jgi:cytochrome c556
MIDGFAKSLLAGIGITPQQAQQTVQLVWNEIQSLRGEKEAFRNGAAAMVANYNSRLDRVEAALARIEAALPASPAPAYQALEFRSEVNGHG